jgi:hypothetical protein
MIDWQVDQRLMRLRHVAFCVTDDALLCILDFVRRGQTPDFVVRPSA